MDIKQNVGLKNKFEIIVSDIDTGEIRQKGYAENIVLNQMYTRLVNFESYFTHIHFGTGTGTTDPTRTTLFNFLGEKSAVTEEQKRELPTSHWMCKVVLNPEEYVGEQITEVGVAYDTSESDLVTHALVQDSEGNPISISKTSSDVVTIYATIFIELGELDSMYGGQIRWITPLENNQLLDYLMGGSFYNSQYYRASSSRWWGSVSEGNLGNSSVVETEDWIKDAVNKKVSTPVKRFGVSTANGSIRSIGFGNSDSEGIFRMIFPVPGVWSGKSVTDELIGTGDGQTKEYNLKWNGAIPDTEEIKIDGVLTEDLTFFPERSFFGAFKPTPTPTPSGSPSRYHCYSPDNNYVAIITDSSSNKLMIYEYDAENAIVGGQIENPTFPSDTIDPISVVFSGDGNYIIILFDAAPWIVCYAFDSNAGIIGEKVSQAPVLTSSPSSPRDIFMTNNNQFIVTMWWSDSEGRVMVHTFDEVTGTIGQRLQNPNISKLLDRGSFLSPDNKYIGLTVHDGFMLYSFNPETGEIGGQIDNPSSLLSNTPNGVSFSPDNRYIAIALNYGSNLYVYHFDPDTKTFGARVPNPASMPPIPSSGNDCTAVSWSPDGKMLAVGFNHGGYLRVFHFDPVEGVFDGEIECPVPPVGGYEQGINHMEWPAHKALSFSYGVNSGSTFSIVPFVQGGGKYNIVFDTPPAVDSVITADYSVPYVPKDEFHVLDVQATIQYGEIAG